MTEPRAGLLRARGAGLTAPQPIELFFDLVYVLAITQVTHHLVEHLTPRGVAETLVLLLAVWMGWIHTVWITNFFDLGARPIRLMLIGVMLTSLIMSASLPRAFEDRGLAFAAALIAIAVGGTTFLLVTIGRGHHFSAVLGRVLVWWTVVGMLLLAGGLLDGDARLAIWALAIALCYVVMWLGSPVPGLGRSQTADYTIAGGHMAERCLLFIIIALGESVLVAGANFGELSGSVATIAAFVIAFIGSVAFWWIYFDRAEEAALQVISTASDPGRLGLIAYSYFHVPMVAGIIAAAAADEVVIAHPLDPPTLTTAALILGGPILFLAGHALFTWAVWDLVSRPRLIAIAALAASALLAPLVSILLLSAIATAVLVALACWDLRTGDATPSHHAPPPNESAPLPTPAEPAQASRS